MEKTIFLFRRKSTRTKNDFNEHYIGHHAPLGRKLARCLLGYTVNLVEGEGGPDALTEHWVPQATDLLTPSIAYASAEDFEKVLVDDQSLFSGFELYVVIDEKVLVSGKPLDSPLGELTPETKTIQLYPDVSALPLPPIARRVVDNIVGHKLAYTNEGQWEKVASDIAVFRMVWAEVGPVIDAVESLRVREYRQIPAPVWDAS